MSYQKSAFRLAIFPLVITGASLLGFAQSETQSQDPTTKARNVKPELKKAYKDWLEKDVTYVITDEERKAFKKLATDDERERFIEEFWRRRDPDPDTDENEFKEEYYERIAYANEHFASGIPGWKSDRGSGVSSIGNNNYTREQDSPFSRLQLLADLSRPPQVKFNDLASAVNTGVIEENPLNFEVRVDFFRQSDERVITAITIQVENKDLVFQDSGGLQQARINIFGRITSVAGRRAGVFEDPVITTATTQELNDAKGRKSAYQKAVALPPGTYKVDVIVRDVASGATGVRHIALPVPKYDPQKLSTSTLVLAARLESLGDRPAVGQFVIGQTKVIPNVSGIYRRGEPVGVYMQVYNAGIDQTTLRPSVDVEYALLKDGNEVGKQAEDWRGMSDSGQRLTLARLIDTRQLSPGEYELAIRIRDRVSGQALAPAAKFTVVQQ